MHYNLGMNMSIDQTNFLLADKPKELENVIQWLESCDTIAVDSESNSLFVYYEKVCLLQFSDREKNAIVDPLAFSDLSKMKSIFAAPSIQKVFHAAEYDVLCLKRDFGFEFNNIFDTMIAARILGKNEVSLAAMLESAFGIQLEKKYQKANWGIRPLPEKMLAYAVHDTDQLIRLKDVLEAELLDRGLQELAQEDFRRVCKTPAGPSEPEPVNWWRITGSNHLTEPQTALLQDLCDWREQTAQKINLPVFKVIQNSVLLDLALIQPQTETQLSEIKGITRTVQQKYGKVLMRILKNRPTGQENIRQPHKTRQPSQAALIRRDVLKNWRKTTGVKHNVPSDVILPREIMDLIIAKNPKSSAQLSQLMIDVPWRYQRFSADILAVLDKLKSGEE